MEVDDKSECKGGVKKQLGALTQEEFPTVIMDATGNPRAMEWTVEWLANGGRIVFVSVVKADISFHDPEFHKRETTLLGSRNATKEDVEHVVQCMRDNRVKSASLITHKAKFDTVVDVFPEWIKPENKVVKAVIEVD